MQYLVALITDINQLIVLIKYISFHAIATRLNLSTADRLILTNILAELDLTRHSHLKENETKCMRTLPIKGVRL